MPIPDSFRVTVPEKKEYELLPDDIYQVKITKLELKENVPVYQSEATEDKLAFEFTIVEEGQFKGRKLWLDVRPTMTAGSNGYSPSWLYKLFSAINRVALDEESAKSVGASDINSMLDKEVRLVVKKEKNRKGEDKNKIKDVLPLKGFPIKTEIEPMVVPASLPIDSDGIDPDDIPF